MITDLLIKIIAYIFIITFHLAVIYVGYKLILLGFDMWDIVLSPEENSLPGRLQIFLISIFGDYTNKFLSIFSFFAGLCFLFIMTVSLILFIFRDKAWIK